MASLVRSWPLFLCFVFSLYSIIEATVPSSTFVKQDTETSENLTISVNVPATASSDDLFFYMSAPSVQGWIAFGIGSEMKGSLIFVAYSSEDGTNVTVSPRLGKGHVMPEHYSNTTVEVLAGSGITNDTYIVQAKCSNCRSWDGGSLDATSTSQSMIFALGSEDNVVKSDSESATIQQHYTYGHFTLNMKAATGTGGVPVPNNSGNSTVTQSSATNDGSISRAVHAILMVGSFVGGYPMGVLLFRIFGKVWMHWLVQSIATLAVILGAASGIYLSVKYDKHPKLNSAHQGIGLALTILVIAQLTLGFMHHRIFTKTKSPTIMGKIHRILGPSVILFGIVNGAIGFEFAGRGRYLITYIVLVTAVALGALGILFMKKRKQRKKDAMNSVAAQNMRRPDIPLENYGHYHGNWPSQRYQ